MATILKNGKLTLTGFVGDYYFEDGFTASDVVVALAEIDDNADLEVHVNSPGGIASEGAAIHALLKGRAGKTDVVVEGIAASAASLLAMAGRTVTMSAGSIMMIHDPSGFTFGTSADHSKTVEELEALATSYSRVYAAKSGKSPAECREIMKAERWLAPDEAVSEGFADDTTEVTAAPVAAFDYRKFLHAPARLTALARKRNWSLETGTTTAASATVTKDSKEKTMSKDPAADDKTAEITAASSKAATDAVAADRKRRKDILALDEAKGREALAEQLHATTMSVEDVKLALAAAPVAATEPAPKAGTEQANPAAYEQGRTQAAGLTAPGGTQLARKPTATLNRSEIYATRSQAK